VFNVAKNKIQVMRKILQGARFWFSFLHEFLLEKEAIDFGLQ